MIFHASETITFLLLAWFRSIDCQSSMTHETLPGLVDFFVEPTGVSEAEVKELSFQALEAGFTGLGLVVPADVTLTSSDAVERLVADLEKSLACDAALIFHATE